jgi:hypothetical protein
MSRNNNDTSSPLLFDGGRSLAQVIYEALHLHQYSDVALEDIHKYSDWPKRLICDSQESSIIRDKEKILVEDNEVKSAQILDLID